MIWHVRIEGRFVADDDLETACRKLAAEIVAGFDDDYETDDGTEFFLAPSSLDIWSEEG